MAMVPASKDGAGDSKYRADAGDSKSQADSGVRFESESGQVEFLTQDGGDTSIASDTKETKESKESLDEPTKGFFEQCQQEINVALKILVVPIVTILKNYLN